MLVQNDDVVFCINKAKEMAEQYQLYCRGHDNPKRSIEDLHWLCSQYLGKKVTLHDLEVAAPSSEIRGCYMANSDGSFDIFLLTDLGLNERRFVACKEMFHVILDQEQCRSMEIFKHIETTTASLNVVSQDDEDEPTATSPVAWEVLAEAAAMEFMFPYEERVRILETAGDDPDYAEYATRYGIPQYYIESYLAEPMMSQLGDL